MSPSNSTGYRIRRRIRPTDLTNRPIPYVPTDGPETPSEQSPAEMLADITDNVKNLLEHLVHVNVEMYLFEEIADLADDLDALAEALR